jgi:hypothetical protein
MKHFVTILFLICNLSATAQSSRQIKHASKVYLQSFDKEHAIKNLVVAMIHEDNQLRSFYNFQMEDIYDYLPEGIPNIKQLNPDKLTIWEPNHTARKDWGDYSLCTFGEEQAQHNSSTVIVGFDTSCSELEKHFGFWGVFIVNHDWCEIYEAGPVTTKSRINVEFSKWVDAKTVEEILF